LPVGEIQQAASDVEFLRLAAAVQPHELSFVVREAVFVGVEERKARVELIHEDGAKPELLSGEDEVVTTASPANDDTLRFHAVFVVGALDAEILVNPRSYLGGELSACRDWNEQELALRRLSRESLSLDRRKVARRSYLPSARPLFRPFERADGAPSCLPL
jgi:hypothetical protein